MNKHSFYLKKEFRPSTSIEDAFKVVEIMCQVEAQYFELLDTWDGGWQATFDLRGSDGIHQRVSFGHSTASMAICMAALKTKELI